MHRFIRALLGLLALLALSALTACQPTLSAEQAVFVLTDAAQRTQSAIQTSTAIPQATQQASTATTAALWAPVTQAAVTQAIETFTEVAAAKTQDAQVAAARDTATAEVAATQAKGVAMAAEATATVQAGIDARQHKIDAAISDGIVTALGALPFLIVLVVGGALALAWRWSRTRLLREQIVAAPNGRQLILTEQRPRLELDPKAGPLHNLLIFVAWLVQTNQIVADPARNPKGAMIIEAGSASAPDLASEGLQGQTTDRAQRVELASALRRSGALPAPTRGTREIEADPPPPGLPAPLAQAEVVDGDFREMEATGPRLRWMRDTRSKLRQRINEDTAHHEEEL
jgi:hypothetical protein